MSRRVASKAPRDVCHRRTCTYGMDRATEVARENVAADSLLEFRYIELQPSYQASFAAWSETTKKHSRVIAHLGGYSPLGGGFEDKGGFSPPQRLPFPGRGNEPYRGDPDEPPWRFDDSWKRLLTEVWYRIAPFSNRLVFYPPKTPMRRADAGDPIPAGWYACRITSSSREEFCHAFNGEELVKFVPSQSSGE
jgi:hypothetical protein